MICRLWSQKYFKGANTKEIETITTKLADRIDWYDTI